MEQPHPTVSLIMSHYATLSETPGYEWTRWSPVRRKFSATSANEFLVGLLLDQGQKAERAWAKAYHLVTEHFQDGDNWWEAVANTHHSTVRSICRTGYNGKSYAESFQTNKFPRWLRSAASHLIATYDGDPRKIWNTGTPADIYSRLIEFDGLGDALAKMGTFILVRNYGVAGGPVNRGCLDVKPDVLLRRVCYRAGIAGTESINEVKRAINALKLTSPADFDAAAWDIGRSFCFKASPNCLGCPLRAACARAGSGIPAQVDLA